MPFRFDLYDRKRRYVGVIELNAQFDEDAGLCRTAHAKPTSPGALTYWCTRCHGTWEEPDDRTAYEYCPWCGAELVPEDEEDR